MSIYGEKTPFLVAGNYHNGPIFTCLGLRDRIRGIDVDCRKIILHRLAPPTDPEVKFPSGGNQRSLNPAGGHYFLPNGHYQQSSCRGSTRQAIVLERPSKKCVGI